MLDNLFQPTHLLVILFIALLVFGPKKLPELGKGLGEGIRSFRESMNPKPETAKPEGRKKKRSRRLPSELAFWFTKPRPKHPRSQLTRNGHGLTRPSC